MSSTSGYCQSCAMPMSDASMYGTDADGGQNHDYCQYCYKDGTFTADIDMNGMIEICVPHMVKAHPDMTEEKAREMMNQFLPGLKRWRKA